MNDRKIAQIRKLLEEAEEKIASVKRIVFEQIYQDQAENLSPVKSGASTVIEGIFDGENMIDKTGKKFIVPANYCSKSKLVAGDKMKLTISPDGSFVFKQIGPVDRKRLVGKVAKNKDDWQVIVDGKKYKCLAASITYFKVKEGDKVTVILPKLGEAEWAVLENLVS